MLPPARSLCVHAGMLIATQANSRTTEACKQSISRGLEVSFASGAVMGNAVVGLGECDAVTSSIVGVVRGHAAYSVRGELLLQSIAIICVLLRDGPMSVRSVFVCLPTCTII